MAKKSAEITIKKQRAVATHIKESQASKDQPVVPKGKECMCERLRGGSSIPEITTFHPSRINNTDPMVGKTKHSDIIITSHRIALHRIA